MTVTQIETRSRDASKARGDGKLSKGRPVPVEPKFTDAKSLPTPKALSESDAKALTSKIARKLTSTGKAVDDIGGLVREAHEGKAHEATGHETFAAWLIETVGDRQLYLSRADRPEVIVWLSNDGMSTRDVAALLDTSKDTVNRAVRAAAVSDETGEGSEPKPEPTADDIADKLAAAFDRAINGLSAEDAADVRTKLHKLTGKAVKAMTDQPKADDARAAA